jgi:hypothetical protein
MIPIFSAVPPASRAPPPIKRAIIMLKTKTNTSTM